MEHLLVLFAKVLVAPGKYLDNVFIRSQVEYNMLHFDVGKRKNQAARQHGRCTSFVVGYNE